MFVVQDELTQCVAAAIEPALMKAETEQARRKTPEQPAVWDLYLRGRWHYYRHTEEVAQGVMTGSEFPEEWVKRC